jgi:MarR family transcriptional regulator, temperature-dependent positive regulator of motility
MNKYQNITEDQLDLMHIIEFNSNASQRQIARKTGLSIGKVNYCLKALVDIGFIKVDNFTKSNQKINYAYILTPKGMQEKVAITKQFIIKNKQEYDKLNSYIY